MQMRTKKLSVQFHLTAAALIRFASIGVLFAVSENKRREKSRFYNTPGSACRSTQARWKKSEPERKRAAPALSTTENVY